MANKIVQLKDGADNLYPCGSIVAATSGFFTASSGMTVRVQEYRRSGHLLQLKLYVNKGGTAFSGREQLGTLNTGFRPVASAVYVTGASNVLSGNVNRYVGLVLNTTGTVHVDAFATTDIKEVLAVVTFMVA